MHNDWRALQAIAVLGYPPVLFPIENEWLILGPQPRDDLVSPAGASAGSGKRSRGRNETFARARSFSTRAAALTVIADAEIGGDFAGDGRWARQVTWV